MDENTNTSKDVAFFSVDLTIILVNVLQWYMIRGKAYTIDKIVMYYNNFNWNCVITYHKN